MTEASLDLAALQARLAESQGRSYWRSIEELAEAVDASGTEAFREFLHREFPRQASEWTPGMDRRQFLRLMGASLALAGLTACNSRPPEKIVPYVTQPEESVPGQALFFATAMPLGGYATGVLAKSHENRPTKIEGNPDHPASLGATDSYAQASVLTLYDPDRAKEIARAGAAADWPTFRDDLQSHLAAQQASGGTGLRILTETVTSPTLYSQLQEVLATFPSAVWHQYEPVNRDNVYDGTALAFGAVVEPIYHLDRADVILSLDADFLGAFPGAVRYARDFADGRRADTQGERNRNRLYVVESMPTITGAAADHRLPLRAGQVAGFVRALARELGLATTAADEAESQDFPASWIGAVARDLQAHAGTGLVLAGDCQPPVVHAFVHAINEVLGNAGQTVTYAEPVVANPVNQSQSIRDLAAAMTAGQVEVLLILGGNPVYHALADVDFAAALEQVPFRVHLGLYADETAARCHWQIPESHYLEAWGDTRAYEGTVTIQQPLIEPLYDSRTVCDILDVLLGETERSAHDIVKAYWSAQYAGSGFETFWQTALHDGVVAGTARSPLTDVLQSAIENLPGLPQTEVAQASGTLEINFRPDPTVWDGRFANNGWLQELPKPLTKLTWENAALINPLTAEAMGLANGDLVELSYRERVVQAPVWLMPGHSVDSVTVHLGYGRTQAGRVGDSAGFNAYALRTADSPWFGAGLTIRKTGQDHRFASTQLHHSMEGRDLIRVGTVDQFANDPAFVQAMNPHSEEISLYPKVEYDGYAWGMAIDMSACIGCNACVTACQAENNIPIVGQQQVANGREMHWIRVDQYYEGDLVNPDVHHQPVTCMHCENAPCEVVCPVAATLHDDEGLNVMVYNRCVGTRYCSNNCPYKVRRFNFLEYGDPDAESLKLQRNPNVTVRSRGVMEKCTYCVQRISAARITAKLEGREIQDGEVVTACQAACPTRAIVFGDINDLASDVAQRKESPLNYGLLTELNTHPRTTYLAKLRNPNPELAGE